MFLFLSIKILFILKKKHTKLIKNCKNSDVDAVYKNTFITRVLIGLANDITDLFQLFMNNQSSMLPFLKLRAIFTLIELYKGFRITSHQSSK